MLINHLLQKWDIALKALQRCRTILTNGFNIKLIIH